MILPVSDAVFSLTANTGVILGSDENTRSEIKYSEEKGQEH